MAMGLNPNALGLPIAISIDPLCSSLSYFATWYLGEINTKFPSVTYGWEFQDAMKERGWCFNRTASCLQIAIDVGFVTSLLPSYDTRMYYYCSPSECMLQPSASQMEPKHAPSCGGDCRIVNFKENDLVDVLNKGGNPGIVMRENESGEMYFDVVNAFEHPFVAISHVW